MLGRRRSSELLRTRRTSSGGGVGREGEEAVAGSDDSDDDDKTGEGKGEDDKASNDIDGVKEVEMPLINKAPAKRKESTGGRPDEGTVSHVYDCYLSVPSAGPSFTIVTTPSFLLVGGIRCVSLAV